MCHISARGSLLRAFLVGALLVSSALQCLAQSDPQVIGSSRNREARESPPAGQSEPRIIVLEEKDFDQVPESVRGASSPSTGLAVLHPTQSASDGEVHSFDPRRDAARDIERAVSVAARDGKHVLVEIGGNWCGFCKALDKFFDDHAEVAQLRTRNYVFVKVNVSSENANEAVLSRYPIVRGIPHFFVLDGKGALVRSQRVALLGTRKGYSEPRFTAFLKSSGPQR